MRYTLLRAVTAALLLTVMVQLPLAQAQSVDDCMSARYADALTICKGIIDNGGRNADVYWKLSSAQYQDGQQDQARRTLSEALRLHPGNAKLETLRDIIATDSTEQALIARSAKLNQASLDKGALKITCLTKSGDVGISACQRRLELTDEDGQRMRARLRELEQTRASSQLAVTDAIEPAEPPSRRETPAVPIPPPVATLDTGPDTRPAANPDTILDTSLDTSLDRPGSGSSDSASTDDAAQLAVDDRREAYKSMVRDVQARLNELGFDAGFPDGVPGSRTRTALADFYSAIDGSGSSSITDLTLEDLDEETRKLQRADPLLLQSQQAANAGNLAQARQLLAQARQISRLVKVPPPLETALQERPAGELPQVALQAPADVLSPAVSGGGVSAGLSGGVSAIVAPPTIPVTAPPVPRAEPQEERPTALAERPTLPAVPPATLASLAPSTTQQTASVADGAAAQTFSELMGRINKLHGQIQRQEADLTAHLDEIRSAL